MSAIMEIEPKTKTATTPRENRTMDVNERVEQLRQKQFYRQGRLVDYRDAFDAGWDAGRAYEQEKGGQHGI